MPSDDGQGLLGAPASADREDRREMSDAKVVVRMDETVTYDAEYTLAEFAEMFDCEPTVEAVKALVDDVSNQNSDYGLEGGEMLLDDMIGQHFTAVNDRSWTIRVDAVEVPTDVVAPAHEPEW